MDVKIIVWNRHHFKDETDMNTITEMLKAGWTDDGVDETLGFTGSETLYGTESLMEPGDNEGKATIEVFSNDNTVWSNGRNPFE